MFMQKKKNIFFFINYIHVYSASLAYVLKLLLTDE